MRSLAIAMVFTRDHAAVEPERVMYVARMG